MSANLQRKLLHILTCFAKKYLKKTNKTEKAFILKGCAMNYKSYRIKIMNHLEKKIYLSTKLKPNT